MTYKVGVAIVTANGAEWIPDLLRSITCQDSSPDRLVIVDDRSTDSTLSVISSLSQLFIDREIDVRVATATSTATDKYTRIAQNFTQAVRMCRDLNFVALSDQDDVWMPYRLSAQLEQMEFLPGMEYLASNANVAGQGTLFDVFDVPASFEEWSTRSKIRHVLRCSVATGGSSMLRVGPWMQASSFSPPPGWLHDRWWSIVASTHGALGLDPTPVIDYRVHPGQQVGLNRGRQAKSGVARIASLGDGDVARFRQLARLRDQASSEVGGELTPWSLAKSLFSNRSP